MSQKIYTNLDIKGNTTIGSIANATTDTDKFLVSDNGLVKYRTGAEMLSDLGVAPGVASNVQHQVKAGVAINKGQAVYVTSADGTNMIVGLASNASEATSSKTMGLLASTVAINGFANVITEGLLAGLNTSTAAAGDPVWLGTDGNLIYGLANKPYAPVHLVFIGIVTRSNISNGEIFVKVQNGFELDELHDVDVKSLTPVSGHILGFNGNLWVNKTIAAWLGYTPANANGTLNKVAKFTSTGTTLGDSQIFDNGTNVLIGTSTDDNYAKLKVSGGSIIINNNQQFNSYKANGLALAIFKVDTADKLVFNPLWGQGLSGYSFTINGSEKMSISTGGSVTAIADMRAPIFYDSGNTSYYLDPASTSNISSLLINGATPFTEGSLALGAHGVDEGGQLVLNKATSWTYAAHIDMWHDSLRFLYGTNTATSGVAMSIDLSTKQLILPAYTAATSFTGTAVANLAVDASGNVITVAAGGSSGVSSIIAGTGVSVSSSTGAVTVSIGQSVATSATPSFDQVFTTNNGNGTNLKIGDDAWIGDINAVNTLGIKGQQDPTAGYITFGSELSAKLGRTGTGALTWGGSTIWNAGNDGSGSGLDADLLDGLHASDFALVSHTHPYDNYQYWNLKTNGVQRTTITSNGTLDLVAGTNVSLSYGAGGVVTISSTDTNTVYTHPAYTARNIDTSGAQVIDIITSDAIGSITNITTRTLTPGDIGAQPAGSYLTTETDTLATVTGRGASTSTFSNFNGGLTAAKTSKGTYGIQIKGGYYGAPRLQLYDLAVDGNAYLGLGTDMSGGSYEFSNYFPRYSGYGRWSVGSWAGDFGSGQYVSGYNEKLWITESASQFNVQLTSTVDMRAPIFYDSDNTAYYIDPTSTSNLSTVNAVNFRASNAYYFSNGNYYLNYEGLINSNVPIRSTADMRAPIFYDSNDTGYYADPNGHSIFSSAQFANGVLDNSNSRIAMPGGAYSLNNTSGTAGAIRINLPTAMYGVNTMMRMTVQVYEYSTGQSFTLSIGGYNYGTHDWYNVFAYLLNDTGKGSDVPVYFGNDGTRDVIWIGNPDWSWSYPNVFVTDFQAGHSQYSNWKTGWSISFDTAARTNVSASRTAYRQIDTGNYTTYAAAASHTHTFDSLTSKTGGIGTYQTSGDFRAPIFYDSNNTAYYSNPNGISSLSQVYSDNLSIFSGKVTLGTSSSESYNGNTTGLTINSTAEIRSTSVQNSPALTFHYEGVATRHLLMNSSGEFNFVSPTNENSGVAVVKVNNNLVWHAGNDGSGSGLDADTLDGYHASSFLTSYSETDTLQTVTSRGNVTSTPIILRTSYPYLQFEDNVTGSVKYAWQQLGVTLGGGAASGGGYFTTFSQDKPFGWSIGSNLGVMTIDTAGNVQALTSSRAPIFYDSNNTAYYTDPNGTSSLSLVIADNTIRSRKSQTDGSYTTAALWTESYNTTTTGIAFHISGTVGKFLEMRTNGVLYWDNGTVWHSGNDGSGSGLDSDTVDGIDSSRIVYGDGARASIESGNMNDPNQKSGFHFAYGPTGAPYTEWWNWITIAGNSWQSSNNYEFQLAHDFHSDGFYVRRMTNGTAASWRQLVDSGNISTFAATTSHTHTFDSLTSKTGGTGTYQTSGDFRAPIFYDSDDTAYYLNPNGTSRLSTTNIYRPVGNNIAGPALRIGKGAGVLIGDIAYDTLVIETNDVATIRVGESDGTQGGMCWGDSNTTFTSTHPFRFFTGGTAGNYIYDGMGGTLGLTVTSGYAQSNGSLRAPIFYDSDNTGYYLNPNGTSNLYSASFGDESNGNQGIDIRYGNGVSLYGRVRFYQGATNHSTIHSFSSLWQNGTLQGSSSGAINLDGEIGTTIGVWSNPDLWIDKNGVAQARNSLRAPIFYDSDNTGYYLNPSSTSYISSLTVDNTINGNISGSANYATSAGNADTLDGLHADGLKRYDGFYDFYVNGDANTYYPVTISASASFSFSEYSISRGYNWDAPNTWNSPSHRGGLTFTWRMTGDSAWGGNDQSIRVVEFAESYSTMVAGLALSTGNGGAGYIVVWLRGGGALYRVHGPLGVNGSFTVHLSGFTGSNGTVYSPRTNTNSNNSEILPKYPVRGNSSLYSNNNLVLDASNYTTYAAAASHSHTFDSLTSKGSGTGTYQTSGDFRAPIFYDSNNTSYYVDPNGASRMGTVNADLLRSYGNLYLDNDYGRTVVGVYSSTRYQGVFAMGDSYKLSTDGTTTGSLYGLAWSHPNAGGVAGNLNTHGLLVMENGTFLAAISGSIRSRDDMRAPIFYDSNNTAYYCDPTSTSNLVGLTVANTISGNISGSANYATTAGSADQIDGVGFRNTGSNSGINADTLESNGITYYTSGVPNFTGNATDGALYSQAYSAAWQHQIAGDYRSGQIAIRGKNSGTWQAWRTVLDSSNVGSYAAPISHTHGLGKYSLTSPANIDGLTTTNFRSTLFGSTANDWQISTARWNSVPAPLGGLGAYGTMLAWAGSDTQGFIAMDYSSAALRVGGGNGNNINWTRQVIIEDAWTNSKYLASDGRFYGTIYYDANDSTYYIDPADTTTSANFQSKINISASAVADKTALQITNGYGNPSIGAYYSSIYTSVALYAGNPLGTAYDVLGNGARFNIFYDRNNTAYYFDGSSTGDSIRVAGDVVAYYSDDRLKDRKGNIENALEKVLSLNGFYYEANQKAQELGYKKKMEVGVSAQEVEAILPELIKDAPIGQGYKTLDYGRLTPLLIEAVKEQQEQIKEQQKQIEELKELVNKLITK